MSKKAWIAGVQIIAPSSLASSGPERTCPEMDKGMHDGHRNRLKRRFLEEGMEQFEPHNVLELLLFYSIPRQDTNETAHRLIDTFGSLSAVFDASVEDLVKVEGVGMNTAILIKLVPAVNRRYLEDRALRGMRAVSSEACGELLVSKFNGVTVERVLLLCMNNQGRVLHCVSISEGTQSMVDINNRRIVEAALRHNASCVVLGHNHPNGVAVPSRTDVETTCMLARLLRSMDIWLYDHIIVADGEYFSMARCNKFEAIFS